MSIKIPSFGEAMYKTNTSDENSAVTVISDVCEASFDSYRVLFENAGYTEKQCYTKDTHRFSAFIKDDEGVFLNYFGGTRELYILIEKNCRYFDFKDNELTACAKPLITQLHLEDFGMSYVVRLADGRFIIIDGGREFEADTDRLYTALNIQSPHGKPIIAAWILTHCHCDHFHAFITFAGKYSDSVTVEKVLYNFPVNDDFAHYRALADKDARFDYDTSPVHNIPLMFEAAEKFGAELITARTGQIYTLGGCVCEILATMDDTIHRAGNVNATSLVIKMELAGQAILWTADMTISDAALNEKYGDQLKCDIMQVPHHGFMSGDPKVLMDFYKIAKPSICLLPASDYTAYTSFSTFMEATDFLMRSAGVNEMITGEHTHTLILPYTAGPDGKRDLERAYLRGRDDCGALTWIFNDMHSENEDDGTFTVFNGTYSNAELDINVYTEDKLQRIRHIKATIPGDSMKKINIFDAETVDGRADPLNTLSLAKQGKPKDTAFCVRIRSNIQVVVSNKNRKADFHSTNR